MSVPQPSYTGSGFVAPLESDILAGVTADINAAFGGNLNPALNTPQGQLASSMAAIIGEVNDTFVYMTNQMNPSFAEGRWQDGIGYIYFLSRKPSTSTVVQATCTGLVGTLIPAGSLAQAADGNVYTSTADGTIGAGGTVSISFACDVAGPIACPAHALASIYQSVLGWDSVDNPADGVIGQDVESRIDFEARRFRSVAKNSLGALFSVLGAVLDVAGVLDAYVVENPTSSPATINGVTLDANCLYVAVVGGAAADVGKAIFTKKAPGTPYYSAANTSVVVYDTNYNPPYPSYTVKWETPAPLAILFAVDIVNSAQVPANAADLIQQAIISAFAGNDGGPRARIGSALYASRYYSGVAALGAWAQIISIQIGCQNNSTADCTTGSISGTTFTEAGVTTGTFAIGQTLVDAAGAILPGTTIVSGTSPTWTVSLSQTVGSTRIYGCLADQNDVTAHIDQSPNLDAANIVVTVT